MRATRSFAVSIALIVLSAAAFGQALADRDRGIDLYRSGQYAESVEIFEKLVTAGEADYQTGLYLGAGYIQTGKNKEARSLLEEIKALKPPMGPMAYDSKLQITSKPQPRFGAAALRSLSAGEVKVLVEFKSDGSIGFAFPFDATSPLLYDGAITAAKGIVFEPAIKNGKPVNTVNILEYRVARY